MYHAVHLLGRQAIEEDGETGAKHCERIRSKLVHLLTQRASAPEASPKHLSHHNRND